MTVDVGSTIDEVKAILGDPFKGPSGPSDNDEEAEGKEEGVVYWFNNGVFHEARCCFRNGRLWRITYWSTYSHPGADLKFIMTRYGDGKKWQGPKIGHMYWSEEFRTEAGAIPATHVQETNTYCREDGELMIICSADPAIVVERMSFPPPAG